MTLEVLEKSLGGCLGDALGIMSSRHPPKDFSNTSKVVTKKINKTQRSSLLLTK
jgi:hypothetical protein